MGFKEAVPYLMLIAVLTSVGITVGYIGFAAGTSDSRNELQKHIAVLTATNMFVVLVLGVLYYYYVQMNTAAFVPMTILIVSFTLFLAIMSVSIAVLQQVSS
jgi:hypothetical protein